MKTFLLMVKHSWIGLLLALTLLPMQGHVHGQAAPDLTVARDAARLGDARADLAAAVGKPIADGPTNALYYTGRHLVWVSFKMPLVSHFHYFRVTDAAKFMALGESRDKDGAQALRVVLTANEIEALLARHAVDTNGTSLPWKKLRAGRWERRDGARAGTDEGGRILIIATQEAWPTLNLDPKK